jgi:hypothetical protein
MAGIEKICEVSGEYVGWDMYYYKRDHIQILPEYRKEFANKKHVLLIRPISFIFAEGKYGHSTLSDKFFKLPKNKKPFSNDQGWEDFEYVKKGTYRLSYRKLCEKGKKFTKRYKTSRYYIIPRSTRHIFLYPTQKFRCWAEYEYLLYVPEVPGKVQGFYVNYSSDIKSVKRNLKKMLKCRKLNVVMLKDNKGRIKDIMKNNITEFMEKA